MAAVLSLLRIRFIRNSGFLILEKGESSFFFSTGENVFYPMKRGDPNCRDSKTVARMSGARFLFTGSTGIVCLVLFNV